MHGDPVHDQQVDAPDGVNRLRSKVRRAAFWSVVNVLVVRFAGIITTVILARILAPNEFGLFAVALVVFNIVISISEMGVSVALVRTTGDISHLAPTVTTIAWLSSAILCALCVVLAPALAVSMGAPEATSLLQVMSLGLLLAGISAVPAAITQRDFRQDRKALAEVSSVVVALGVAVPMALGGWGAWSLVWSRLIGLAVTAVVLIVMTGERYWPGLSLPELLPLLRFGVPLAGASILVLGVMNIDSVVVSRELGVEQLAFYSMAFNISSWPVAAFSAPARNVSVAWLSNLRTHGRAIDEGVAQFLRPLMVVTIPVCVGLAVLAHPLVEILYGSTWLPAAAPLTVLALLGATRVLLEVGYDTLVSDGRSGAILIIHAVWLGLLIPALIVGSKFGLVGVAWAHVTVVFLVVCPLYLRVVREIGVHPVGIGRALRRPVVGGALIVLVAMGARLLPGDPILHAVAVVIVGGVAHALVVVQDLSSTISSVRTRRFRSVGGSGG